MNNLQCSIAGRAVDIGEAFALFALARVVGDRQMRIRCALCNGVVRPVRGRTVFLDHGHGSPFCVTRAAAG